jgi:hypothetical protein
VDRSSSYQPSTTHDPTRRASEGSQLVPTLHHRAGLELRDLLAEYRKSENYEVNDLGGGIWRLSFVFPGDNYSSSRWEIDIDTLNGFTPIESKLKEHLRQSGRTFVTQASKVTWKQHDGAWVPTHTESRTGMRCQARIRPSI